MSSRKYPKKYLISSYTPGLTLNIDFLYALRRFAKRQNAEIAFLLTNSIIKDAPVADEIAHHKIINSDKNLNKNLGVTTIHQNPTASNPLSSLNRIGRRNKSLIVPGNKLMLEDLNGTNGYPHTLLSTGSINRSKYKDIKQTRMSYIATHEHDCAAIFVEIEDSNNFYIHHLESDSDGSFIFDGKRYYKNCERKENPEAVYLGDPHFGEHDQAALNITLDKLQKLKPKHVFMGDYFSGSSVSPHEKDDREAQLRRFENGEHRLEDELKECAKNIDYVAKYCNTLFLIRGNHEDWLYRFTQWNKSEVPVYNYRIWKDLNKEVSDGKDLLKFALVKYGNLQSKNVRFLDEDTSIKIQDAQMGFHGDETIGGARRPSINGFEKSLGSACLGHFHARKIQRKMWVAGTLMNLRPEYVSGPSNWSHSSIAIYRGKRKRVLRQFLTIVNNKMDLNHKHDIKEETSSKSLKLKKAA